MLRILFAAAAARARPVHRSPPLTRTCRSRVPEPGQQPNPNYGTVPWLHRQLLVQRLHRRVRNELAVACPLASSGRRPGLSLSSHRAVAWLGTVREDLKFRSALRTLHLRWE